MNRREAIKAMVDGKTIRRLDEPRGYTYSMESISDGYLDITRRYNGKEVGFGTHVPEAEWKVVE